MPQSVVGGWMSPLRILSSRSRMRSTNSCGTSGLIFPTATPSLRRSKTRSRPPVNSSFAADRMDCRVYREGKVVKRFKGATKEAVARWIVSALG